MRNGEIKNSLNSSVKLVGCIYHSYLPSYPQMYNFHCFEINKLSGKRSAELKKLLTYIAIIKQSVQYHQGSRSINNQKMVLLYCKYVYDNSKS